MSTESPGGSDPAATSYDVAIVGGGLVGASLACALAPLGLRIALLEAVPPRAEAQPSYDDRTLALSASSCHILEAIGLWPLLADNATPIRAIHVRELGRPGSLVLRPEELGLDRFGHVVEARTIGAAMRQHLPELAAVDLRCPARLTALDAAADGVLLRYELDGVAGELFCRLAVGADGAGSTVREALGIDAERRDYGQTAIVCNVTPQRHHAGHAFEFLSPTGPFALLPHVGGRCGLVWSVAHADAEPLLRMPDQEFMARAEARFGDALGPWLRIGRRSAYPLTLTRALDDLGPRTVLLGNAAHAIHPVGAQGFNLGLRDVAALAEVIADARLEDADVGHDATLRRYSEWRAPDQSATIAFTDGLTRLFANPTAVAAAMRRAGLFAHAVLPPLRRRRAIEGMGFRGRIPRLALGERLVRV